MAENAGTVAAFFLYIVGFRQGRNLRPLAFELSLIVKNNFRAIVVQFYRAMDLDRFSCQLRYVADISQIAGKNHDRERTGVMVLAEVQKMHTFVPLTNF